CQDAFEGTQGGSRLRGEDLVVDSDHDRAEVGVVVGAAPEEGGGEGQDFRAGDRRRVGGEAEVPGGDPPAVVRLHLHLAAEDDGPEALAGAGRSVALVLEAQEREILLLLIGRLLGEQEQGEEGGNHGRDHSRVLWYHEVPDEGTVTHRNPGGGCI